MLTPEDIFNVAQYSIFLASIRFKSAPIYNKEDI
jgi:hypothetical protein